MVREQHFCEINDWLPALDLEKVYLELAESSALNKVLLFSICRVEQFLLTVTIRVWSPILSSHVNDSIKITSQINCPGIHQPCWGLLEHS